jgi:hypothetical protein
MILVWASADARPRSLWELFESPELFQTPAQDERASAMLLETTQVGRLKFTASASQLAR